MLKLKELEQNVLYAFYFKDLNQTEIARQMGISCNYVSHILRNATKKLKKILAADELRNTQIELVKMRHRLDVQRSVLDQTPIVDDLTRLYNRRYYDNRLQEEVSRASRMAVDLSVIFIRIEGLEAVARHLGTLRRDEVTVGMATVIQNSVRRVDILTRYETETFALILPFTGANVDVVTARIRQEMEAWLVAGSWNADRPLISFEIGSAVYPRDSREASVLSELAMQDTKGMKTMPRRLPKAA